MRDAGGLLGRGAEAQQASAEGDRARREPRQRALFVAAVSILLGSGGGGSGGPDRATGGVLGRPAGQVLVAIAGLAMIGVGLEQGYKAVNKKFLENSKNRLRRIFDRGVALSEGVSDPGSTAERSVSRDERGLQVLARVVEDQEVGDAGGLQEASDGAWGTHDGKSTLFPRQQRASVQEHTQAGAVQ
jgi:hypothetical protein